MIVTNGERRLENKVKIHDKSTVEIERMCSWCHEHFGKRFSIVDRPVDLPKFGRNGTWQCTHDGRDRDQVTYIFSFDHEKYATRFSLRWAN
jgi:hypothetical protein